jgi:D-alanine-D-alanine ligase
MHDISDVRPGRTLRVAVIFGGRSTEYAVSCKSAASMVQFLDRTRYEVLPVRITPDGAWIVGADKQSHDRIDVAALLEMTPDPGGVPAPSSIASMAEALEQLTSMDVVIPCLHGTYGEDGTIQSVLEWIGVPYVGSGVLASAASMDKEFTKKILAAEGLAVADGVVLRNPRQVVTGDERDRLGLPVFVKPASGGSSIGVSRVDDWADLDAAVVAAFSSDTKVLVEAAVPGREIDLGVLELPDGRVITGPSLEIKINDEHTFFDYDAKYVGGTTTFVIPADIDPAIGDRLAEAAVRTFRALGCSGLLRVDFFVHTDAAGRLTITVNEVNTMPGFTAVSQYPQMWQVAGTAYPDLLDLMIMTALRRGASV